MAQFGVHELEVRSGGAVLGMRLIGYGYGNRLNQVASVGPQADANRIIYRRGTLIESYANESVGLEQSFTLMAPPAGGRAGTLTLALGISGNVRGLATRRTAGITFRGHRQTLSYRRLIVSDATGKRLPAHLQLRASKLKLLILIDDGGARYPLRIDPVIQAASPSDPYGQAVLADQPTTYLRLNESGGSIAYDSSGNGNDATYEPGVTFGTAGPLTSLPGDTAVSWNDPTGSAVVTQSGSSLPSGNSVRTVEFWARTGDCQASETIQYGNPSATNGQFSVQVNAGNCQPSRLMLSTAGQSVQWALPAAWDDSAWHLFDVTYDGAIATGYMDGQVVGNSAITTPLATVTPGNGFSVNAAAHSATPAAVAEVAVYPTALTPTRIDAHWTASAVTSCAAGSTDPYGQGVVADGPSLYFRLGDLVNNPADRIAYDSSGHCTASAPANGAYTAGTTGDPDGVSLGYPTGAVKWGDPAGSEIVTQSGPALPSANSPRTVEFWSRTPDCQASETIQYGNSSITNGQFSVQVNAGNCGASRLILSTAGQSTSWALPTAWDNGAWHMFAVTYDGSTTTGYMDGQVVGSTAITTPLATVTPGNGFNVFAAAHPSIPDAIAEVAVYPTALSSNRILAHFESRFTLPAGMYLIAGNAVFGNGSGAQGAREQACPTSGGSCVVDPYPADPSGFFHLLAPAGTYTVTIYPPAGSPSPSQTLGPVTVPPSALTLSATFSPPNGLPNGVTFSTPSTGPQQNVVPTANWSDPSTLTIPGCTGGFGIAYVQATSPSTGQLETISTPLVETPAGSGTYVATIPPLAPLHGSGSLDPQITCPGHTPLLPDGGSPSGGTSVLLAGSGFTGATAVMFGAQPASSFAVLSDNVVAAVSPPGTGNVAVTVTSASSTPISVGNFNYFAVTSVSPNEGPATGGNTVTIYGQGFNNTTGVMFGLMPSSSVTVVNSGEIQATAPLGLGTVDVQVLNGFAISQPSLSATYTFQGGPPGSSSISEPTSGGDGATTSLANQIQNYCASQNCGSLGYGALNQNAGEYNNPPPTPAAEDPPPSGFDRADWLGLTNLGIGTALTAVCALAPEAAVIPGIGETVATFCLAASFGSAIGSFIFGYLDEHKICFLGLGHCNVYIDPSGTVVDTNKNPIANATATILEQGAGGVFAEVPANSGLIQPNTNPENTPATGAFDWDALAGTYEIEASAAGCFAPGNPSQPNVFTSPFTIPPPAVGLMLTLQCSSSPPPPVPTVTAVAPAAGAAAGGNTVEIMGTGLAGATSVQFGSQPATQTQVLSPYAIAAVAPAGSGTVDITVTTPGGTSAQSSADDYTYVPPGNPAPGAPTVTTVAPASGPLSGGTLVTITGSGLSGAYEVDFGGTAASQVTNISATQVQAVAPASQFPVRLDISIMNPAGASTSTPADVFTYGSPPPPAATNVTVGATASAVLYGQPVTLTAAVSPTDGAGTIAFSADGSAIGGCGSLPLALSEGSYKASCSTAQLPGGNHTITAAYNGDASYAASRNSTSLYVDATPHNTAAPLLSGNTTEGQTLTESHGTWTNDPTSLAYQWQDCDPSGNACSNIAAATAQTYTLTATDVGHTIRVQESATNSFGAGGPVSSAQTGMVAASGHGPPVNSIPPNASGAATNGKTVSSTTGTWSGEPPLTYSYQWQRCAPKCANIAGATASTYKLTSVDIGAKVRAGVTAANSAGRASANSNEVGPVQPTPAQISAAVRKVLAPSGKAAKIGAVLKAGGFRFMFNAPGPGKLTISWYQVPAGAHLARKAKPKPVLVATVRVSFAKAGGAKIKVKLTGAGRRLLRGSRKLKLTSKVTLTPVGGTRTSRRRTFIVRR